LKKSGSKNFKIWAAALGRSKSQTAKVSRFSQVRRASRALNFFKAEGFTSSFYSLKIATLPSWLLLAQNRSLPASQ